MKLVDLAKQYQAELDLLYGKEEAEAIFLLVVKHYLGYRRVDYTFKKNDELAVEVIDGLAAILQQLKVGKPLQYILGETEFYGLKFQVNPAVLIPRPETEELVEWIISAYSSQLAVHGAQFAVDDTLNINRQPSIVNILDIGTGSGCIAIALQKNLPHTQVYALDIAADSLAIAQANALLNKVDVEFIQQDILDPSYSFEHQLDVIVSNPPYIKEDEKADMHQNVLANEPHRALFVSNENPLLFYHAIADFALKNLKKNGHLYFEINEYLSEETVMLLASKGFKNIELKKDMQGKDRMVNCNL